MHGYIRKPPQIQSPKKTTAHHALAHPFLPIHNRVRDQKLKEKSCHNLSKNLLRGTIPSKALSVVK